MATLEQVEKLREKANVSFEEAKTALEACNDDLLDAIIYLEKQGRVTPPTGGGSYSSQGPTEETTQDGNQSPDRHNHNHQHNHGSAFKEMLRKVGEFIGKMFRIGNTNVLEAHKNGRVLFGCPVTALVVLLIFLFWVVVPLFIVSLFFGFRYRFVGEELGTEPVNKVMDGASTTADDIKKNFNHDC